MKDGKLELNLNDEIIRETLLTRDGEVVNARVREFLRCRHWRRHPREQAEVKLDLI